MKSRVIPSDVIEASVAILECSSKNIHHENPCAPPIIELVRVLGDEIS